MSTEREMTLEEYAENYAKSIEYYMFDLEALGAVERLAQLLRADGYRGVKLDMEEPPSAFGDDATYCITGELT